MIARFYKKAGYGDFKLIKSVNIDHIPELKTFVHYSGQTFIVDRIYFDLNSCSYNVYLARV